MTAKEFLQQAYFANKEVETKLEQISRLQALATRVTTTIRNAPSGGSLPQSRIENAVADMQEKIEQLSEEVLQVALIVREVSTAISRVQDVNERVILEYRYLCFFSWRQISHIMKIGLRQTFRLHTAALKNFSGICQQMSVNVSRCHVAS